MQSYMRRVDRRRVLRSIGAGVLSILATPLLTGCPTNQGAAVTVAMNPQSNFSPSGLTIAKGTKVIWKNTDPTPHTTTCDPAKVRNATSVQRPKGAAPWDSGVMYVGDTFARTFDVSGTYVYLSVPDEGQGMIGTITVTG
ncbi:MAG: plastocyanin/azurin family copper-binding protein [Chloroflexota bacterium]|nr:plastocyanin/azurin family copper-binding protein [Chloroflexota bacterium]